MECFRSVARKIETKCRKAFLSPIAWLDRQVFPRNVMKLGATDYGGWRLVEGAMRTSGKALLCGAGEDISFDLAVQKHFSCEVIIVDPTPRAKAHFDMVLDAQRVGSRIGINNSRQLFYDLDGVDFAKIHFVPLAVWHERSRVKFWFPYFSDHVSHSITNYQGTSKYIEVDADTLDGIMEQFKIPRAEIDLLKLDIEGAEYTVIDWMCDSSFLPRQLLIEYDEMNFPNFHTRRKISMSVSRLQQSGYNLVHFDGRSNCVFLKE